MSGKRAHESIKISIFTVISLFIVSGLNLAIFIAQSAERPIGSLGSTPAMMLKYMAHEDDMSNFGLSHSAGQNVVVQLHPNQINERTVGSIDGNESSNMGVYAMDWFSDNHLSIIVNIRSDSNGSEGLDAEDERVSRAGVTFLLIFDSNNDGTFDCSLDKCWIFGGRTDDSGNFKSKVPGAPVGNYQGEVTSLTHDTCIWDRNLDLQNPDNFAR
jgi:hypothetical protein